MASVMSVNSNCCQEAGFTPLEVLRTATAWGAELLGIADNTGTLEIGKRADILIHGANPLNNFKLLYGTGAMRLNDASRSVDWDRSLEQVIKGGILYDAAALLEDVKAMVATARTGVLMERHPPPVRSSRIRAADRRLGVGQNYLAFRPSLSEPNVGYRKQSSTMQAK